MTVIERKPIPIYEVECFECKSKIQYKKSEVFTCHITCPVCGVSLWADTINPVKMENEVVFRKFNLNEEGSTNNN